MPSDAAQEFTSPGAELAASMYPTEDGEQTEQQPDETAQQVNGEDKSADALSDAQADDAAKPAEGSTDDDKSPPQDSAQADGDGEEVRTVSELVEHLGVDEEWIEGLEITRKINGEERSVKLGDILAKADKYEAGDAYLADAKEQSKAILKEATDQRDAVGEEVVVFSKLVETAREQLASDRKGINWKEKRESDPAEYAALREEFRAREEEIKNIEIQARDVFRKALEDAERKNNERLKEDLPNQRKILFERLPDWAKDEDKSKKESSAVFQYLRDQGYDEKEVTSLTHNGRDLSLAVKAMRYDQIDTKRVSEETRVRTIPKVLKPGADKNQDGKQASEPPKDRTAILYPNG